MKKPSRRSLVLLILILFLIIAIPAAAELTVRFQPANHLGNRDADLPTSSSFVSVRLDEGLFTLFAALNAAGYDDENFDFSYHPVRLQVRQELSERNFSGLERLRSQLKFVNTYQFTVWSLHYNAPPDFTRRQSGWAFNDIPALLFLGMDDLMREFYDEMEIRALWQQVKPEYERVGQEYQQAAGAAVLAALEYTRMQDADLRQVVVIPNLLDAHYRGYGPQVGDIAYVVVGPTGDGVDVGLIQHEALHSIAGPLVEEHFDAIDADQGQALYRVLRQQVPQGYGSWEGIVEEHVVRALGCRLAGAACEQYLLENDEASGFLLMRPLVDQLLQFEASSMSLDEFMPEMLGALNAVQLP